MPRLQGARCLSCHATGVGSTFVQPVKELPAIGSPGGHVATNGADCGSCHCADGLQQLRDVEPDGDRSAWHGAHAGGRECLLELPRGRA